MGNLYKKYLPSDILYSCSTCSTHLVSSGDIVSKSYMSKAGRAYLASSIVNISIGETVNKTLSSGNFDIADVICNGCDLVLGWKYITAYNDSQKFKEDMYIIDVYSVCNLRKSIYSKRFTRSPLGVCIKSPSIYETPIQNKFNYMTLLAALHFTMINFNDSMGSDRKVDDLQEKINLVSAMFPHIPKEIIQNEIKNGSSVEQTCQKIIDGRIDLQSNTRIAHDQSNAKSLDKQSERSKIALKHLNGPDIQSEPPKVWESEIDKRQELLKQRKAYMIQQARLKFLKDND